MMISACRDKRRTSPPALHHLEPEDVAVGCQSPIEIRHLQVNMTDRRARIDWLLGHSMID